MNSVLSLVQKMHEKFEISPKQKEFSTEEKEFRILGMKEELIEYEFAQTKEEEFDALLDLIVFALGTIDRQGWSDHFEEGFRRVMNANMAKKLGSNAKRNSFVLDLVKPENWQAPQFSDLLFNSGGISNAN